MGNTCCGETLLKESTNSSGSVNKNNHSSSVVNSSVSRVDPFFSKKHRNDHENNLDHFDQNTSGDVADLKDNQNKKLTPKITVERKSDIDDKAVESNIPTSDRKSSQPTGENLAE